MAAGPGAAAAYRGRFAPSPTGLLHAGSLVAALASWLDARAHRGAWLVRIEDVDTPRCVAGADHAILDQLQRLGLVADEAPWWQSRRGDAYAAALQALQAAGAVYPCGCTRKQIEAALAAAGHPPERFGELVYPGTCRQGLNGKPARAWRVRCGTEAQPLHIGWHDHRLGDAHQDLTHEVGDFIVRRADGLWAYQLAVVVDDAAQRISDVVRGEDLADNTPRQIHLQRLLGLPTPRYLHTPLVLAPDGHKLSKQNGAAPLALGAPGEVLQALRQAGQALGLPPLAAAHRDAWLAEATAAWARIHGLA
ncbi:tRNA glutamyl-Q(34) synthetase GluQRS [Aquincola tertiaricarbonis]|uniref:tRNA glutamyl-Q(34) synthetase GluQRS n=1 Tax=Aquincola tertiaricarbonis TaxID=391953 RepID=UPI0006149CFE|nr:tRNA glutamyl-Q(34) synthetase GluQRS [Aquincola tertiaricarbonis]